MPPTIPPGGVEKDAKIQSFITSVINAITSTISRDASSVAGSINFYPNNSVEQLYLGDLCNTSDFQVTPANFSSIGTQSTINSRSGRLEAAALADLFMFYAYNLTSIKQASFRIQRTNDGNNAGTTAIGGGTVTTALSAKYRMPLNTFRTNVNAGTNPFDNLQPGNVAAEAAIDALIARLYSVVNTHRTSTTVNLVACHSSCHSSCHGSRGRR